MNYTIVGTGNMAHFLAMRLQAAGWRCTGVWGRKLQQSEALAGRIQAPVISSLRDIPDETDLCIVAVSDHAIIDVAQQLHLESAVVIHTAGSVSLEVLPQKNKGVLWPVYSIVKEDLPEQRDIPVVYEANNALSEARVLALAQAITDNVQPATTVQRQWMHLIAALSNNFTNHIIAIAELLSKEQQISFDLFQPILSQTFARAKTGNALSSQTGAAKRNDAETMQKHVSLLASHPQWQELYKMLSSSIKDLYKHNDQ